MKHPSESSFISQLFQFLLLTLIVGCVVYFLKSLFESKPPSEKEEEFVEVEADVDAEESKKGE